MARHQGSQNLFTCPTGLPYLPKHFIKDAQELFHIKFNLTNLEREIGACQEGSIDRGLGLDRSKLWARSIDQAGIAISAELQLRVLTHFFIQIHIFSTQIVPKILLLAL